MIDLFKGLPAIEIVGIDHRVRRILQSTGRHQRGMRGSPGFHTAIGNGKARGDILQHLKHIAYFHEFPHIGKYGFLKSGKQLFLDNEQCSLKTGLSRVIQRIIDNFFPKSANGVDLL